MTKPVNMNFGAASSPDINQKSQAKEQNTTRDMAPLISVAYCISLPCSLKQRTKKKSHLYIYV